MGLFAKLRGTERTPGVDAGVERLQSSLPDGWKLVETDVWVPRGERG